MSIARFLTGFFVFGSVVAGLTRPSSAAEHRFKPALRTEGGYTETFTLSADLPGGGIAQVQFGFTNVGPGDGKAICRVLVKHGKHGWRGQSIETRGEWRYDSEGSRLSVGGCAVEDGERPVVQAKSEEGDVEIRFLTAPTAVIPAGSRFEREKAWLQITALAAGVPVAVRLRDAKGAEELQTAGFLEHLLATEPPDHFARSWYRYRSFGEGAPAYGLIAVGAEPHRSAGWHRGATSTSLLRPKITDEGTRVEIRAERFATDFENGRTITEYAPLREMGMLGRLLAAVVGDPLLEIRTFEWHDGGAVRRAVVERTTFR